MTIEEVFKSAHEAADKWWNQDPPKNSLYTKKWEFYRDMMKDLRAIGNTDEEIWEEFITQAFIYGFCQAHRDVFEKDTR